MDPDEKRYGKLLYQETDEHFDGRKKRLVKAANKMIGYGIVLIVLPVGSLVFLLQQDVELGWDDYIIIIPAFLSIMLFNLGKRWKAASRDLVKLAIYENAINQSDSEEPDIVFSQIDHIILGHDTRSNSKYFYIHLKGKKYPSTSFANGNMKWANKYPEDYDKIFYIVTRQLKKANPDVDESKLIRKR